MNSNWFNLVPKVELHLHLEGAIPHEALWTLIQKYDGDPEAPSLDALKENSSSGTFPTFWKTGSGKPIYPGI